MKKRISLILAILILFLSMSVSAETIWEGRDLEKLAKTVTHEHIERFTTSGWLNLHVVRVNTRDSANEIVPIFSGKGISNRESVLNMMNENDLLAAVNASFFNKDSTLINTMVRDGKVLVSAGKTDDIPSFVETKQGDFVIGNYSIPVGYYNVTKNYYVDDMPYNRFGYSGGSPVSILDSNNSKMSIGKKYGDRTLEVVVRNDLVVELRENQPPIEIPADGYVITGVDYAITNRSLDKIDIGDKLSLEFENFELPNIKNSISGGTVILEKGQVVEKGIKSPGKHPRTALGINWDGSEIIFLTVDGRHSSFKGVDLATLAGLMRELGAVNAINFDGGGSTNMGIKARGEDKATIVNIPSQKNRQVVNAIGVRNTDTEVGPLTSLKLDMNDTAFIYIGTDIKVTGYDDNMNKLSLDPSEITYSLSGLEGTFEGSKFTPKSQGNGTITVTAGGVSKDLPIRVIGSILDIEADTKLINVSPGESVELPSFTAIDTAGTSGRLDPSDVGLTVYGDIGSITEGRYFQAGSVEKRGAISAKFGEGVENIIVNVGSRKVPISVFNKDAVTVSKYPDTVEASILAENNQVTLNYDFTKSDQTRAAYVDFVKPAKIPEDAISIGMTVVSDGNGAWLRGVLVDSKGTERTVDFSRRLDTVGDIYVEADVPAGDFSLKRIYPVETESQNKYVGQLVFKNPTVNYPHNSAIGNLPKASSSIDPKKTDNKLPNSIEVAFMAEPTVKNNKLKFNSHAKYANSLKVNNVVSFNNFSDKYKQAMAGRTIYNGGGVLKGYSLPNTYLLTFTGNKGSIWESSPAQWREIRNLSNRPEKNILISIDTKIFGEDSLSDKKEADLFHKFMKDLKAAGKNVIVVEKSKVNYNTMRDGVRYIQVNRNYIESNADFKKITSLVINLNDQDFTFRYHKPF